MFAYKLYHHTSFGTITNVILNIYDDLYENKEHLYEAIIDFNNGETPVDIAVGWKVMLIDEAEITPTIVINETSDRFIWQVGWQLDYDEGSHFVLYEMGNNYTYKSATEEALSSYLSIKMR